MRTSALVLALSLALRAAAGPCTHDEYRKSLDEHCVQLMGEGQKLFGDAAAAEQAQDLGLAKERFARAFQELRQAGLLGRRPESKTLSPAVVRLLLVKATEASRRYAALGKRLGASDEALGKELEELKRQADAELQERLDCIQATPP